MVLHGIKSMSGILQNARGVLCAGIGLTAANIGVSIGAKRALRLLALPDWDACCRERVCSSSREGPPYDDDQLRARRRLATRGPRYTPLAGSSARRFKTDERDRGLCHSGSCSAPVGVDRRLEGRVG